MLQDKCLEKRLVCFRVYSILLWEYVHVRRQIEFVRSKSSDKLDYMFASRCRHSRRNTTSDRCVDRSQ